MTTPRHSVPRRHPVVAWIAIFSAALAVSLAACSEPTAAPGTHIDELAVLSLDEEVRIGSFDDPVTGFSRIGDVWVAPDGEVWVAETQADEIRVYSSDGELLRTYGRSGDGPGEFRSIYDFGLVGDTLWVSDSGHRRTTLFSLDGDVLETVTAQVEVSIGGDPMFPRPLTITVFPHALRPDGLIESDFIGMSYANLADSMASIPKVLFDRSGQVVDTAEVIERRVSRTAEMIEWGDETGGGWAAVYQEPPAEDSGTSTLSLDEGSFSVQWDASADGATGRLVVARLAEDGDTTFVQRLQYDPRPVTDRYLDSIAAQRAGGGRRSRSDSVRLFQAQRAALQRPDHHEPVRFPSHVGGGVVWTRLDPDIASVSRWLVYRDDTQELGIVELPVVDSFLRSSDGTSVWIMERDEFRVPWLARYRIGWSLD